MKQERTGVFEFGILSLLLFIVIVLVIFGMYSQADATDALPSKLTSLVLAQASILTGQPVTYANVTGLTVTSYLYSRAAVECPNTPYVGANGYKITFKFHNVAFDYRVIDTLRTITLCHVGV